MNVKTWEMLKELTENPNKRFKIVGSGKTDSVVGRIGNSVNWVKSGSATTMFIDEEWEEVRTEVTWQEAIEAWAKGSTVTCHLDTWIYTYKPRTGDLFIPVVDDCGDELSADEILEGKWYIL